MKINSPAQAGMPTDQRKLLEYVRQRMQGGLTLKDNFKCALLDLSFDRELQLFHEVERIVPNPLGTARPLGFEVVYAEDSDGLAIEYPAVKFNPRPLGGDGKVRSGHIGLTARYSAEGQASGYIGERKSAKTDVGSALTIATTGAIQDIGSIVLGAGSWNINCGVGLGLGSATGAAQGRVWINTASATDPTTSVQPERRATFLPPTAGTNSSGVIAGYQVTLTAEATYYGSGTLTFTGGSNATIYGYINATRVAPYMTGYSGRVIGILWGG